MDENTLIINNNSSVWRIACRIAAWVDLVSQIMRGSFILGTAIDYVPILILSKPIGWLYKAVFAMPIVLIMIIQIIFFAGAILMIKGSAKGRKVQDVITTVSWWISGQTLTLMLVAFCAIFPDYWDFCLFESLIRIPTIYIGSKFIYELQKETGNNSEDLEV